MLKSLEGVPAKKLPVSKPQEKKATVLYIGRIPHGFYENEMEGTAIQNLWKEWVGYFRKQHVWVSTPDN